MLRVVFGQLLRRRARSLAVVAAIVVAAVSFSLLSSAVATSQLNVKGTVTANFRAAYDILVRPAGSRTPLETADRLIQENYLSGIYGGISLAQYHEIQQVPGISVAAPVAMIGYMMPWQNVTFPASRYLTGDSAQLLRIRVSETGDNGLSHYPGATQYVYVTGRNDSLDHKALERLCLSFQQNLPTAQSAFDLPALTRLSCYLGGSVGSSGRPVRFGAGYYYPILLAAIDPVQEAKLVGLNKAIVSGRYLTAQDKTRTQETRGGHYQFHQVPVLMANQPLTSDSMTFRVQRLHVSDPARIPARLAGHRGLFWLSGLPGTTLRTSTVTDQSVYPRLLKTYTNPTRNAEAPYWSVGHVGYTVQPDGSLVPRERANDDPQTWYSQLMSTFVAPQANADVGFRTLTPHPASNEITGTTLVAPAIHEIGVFDPGKIEGFSSLSQVPLTTYYPPDASPGDPRTTGLLHGHPLLPSENLAGYLQQPPMMLTTIKSLRSFTDPQAFGNVARFRKAPISVVRVRVAGVTGVDSTSMARIRLVAAQIVRETGLDVDITVGSSPTPERVDLPAGKFGRPPLVLSEGWVKKGVAVALLSAVDAKSLALFGLVLLVCLLFLVNATVAAVRTRRRELGVLACIGWPARRIFLLLEVELVALGLTAGIVGTAVAIGITLGAGLQVSWFEIGLITPVAVVLTSLAGIHPAWRACRATPIEAITPSVRAPRRATHVTSVTRLALVGLGRWPGRTVLGAASLAVGVAALTALIAIQREFQGGVVGTSLGNVVAIQVRGVDYLAAALTIVLGAFAVADVAYLNISERTAEIATLRSTGWRESHVRRLFGTEGLLTAVAGALTGASVSIGAVALVLPVDVLPALTSAVAAAGIGILSAVLALLLPLGRLARLSPAAALTEP